MKNKNLFISVFGVIASSLCYQNNSYTLSLKENIYNNYYKKINSTLPQRLCTDKDLKHCDLERIYETKQSPTHGVYEA
ncbi:hypothetical protein [Fluviispira sanaruensis]|uniref:Uncharacterized protein n=1 Tax=Fluviispira sanaruensis TaxID=2493639 RepID=A0A4V0P278_FLUSA|nr:hypothetical protein [Fluviispira sanaruensis]BBH52277.1 hypothetical protein JCM31447_07180 [Fluviispira sanaruensis]